MAFDGSIVYALAKELDAQLKDGRISRIIQPEKDELLLTVKQGGCQKRVLLSVNPSLPMVYLTDQTKNAPITAPTFCMLLRKHLTGGRILSVTQPSMERIIDFEIEHYNEMGDLCRKTLTIELMNKYSNIILRQDNQILDSIKHISSLVSSVREVLPGREYFIPFSNDKINPFRTDCKEFSDRVYSVGSFSAAKAIYSHVTGFSPMLAEEVLYRSGIDSDRSAASLLPEEQRTVYAAFQEVMRQIACASVTVSSGTSDTASFDCVESPKEVKSQNCRKAQEASRVNIIYQGEEPVAYGAFHYRLYEDPSFRIVEYDSISRLLSDFYSKKQALTSMRQKTAALRQTVHTLLNKNNKKYDLQQKQLKDTEKKNTGFTVSSLLLMAIARSPAFLFLKRPTFIPGKQFPFRWILLFPL